MKIFPFFCLIIFLFAVTITAQEQYDKSGKEKINYRRTETSRLPTTDFQQPKERVFPLGWNTRTLDKVTSGTGIWTELNPNVPRVSYFGLDFINADTGWACGGSGAIIKTTNGGDDWSIAETPVTSLLFKIHSYNGQVVIATGFENTILRSSDGGETFEQVPSGLGSDTKFWGVQMLNDTLGWICGMNQTLLKTTDGGINWQQVFPGLNQHYWSLEFLTEQYGFIVCEGGKVLKTIDGGNNWTVIQAGDARALYTVDIIDSLHIVAAGEFGMEIQYDGGKNVYSSDGGETWAMNPDIPTGDDANWIEFMDRDTGYSVSVYEGLWKTTNRGVSWFNPNTSNSGGDWQIELLEDGTGYYGGEGLNIYKRTNGLDNWSKIFFNLNWSDVFFIDEMKGYLISSDVGVGLYKTEDGGISYQKVENAPGGFDLLFLDSLTGFIGGTHKTTDGGETWYATNGGSGTKVFFINNTTGWAVGGNVIYKTTDVGENWFTQLTLPADNFTSIYFVDSLSGWATSRYVWQTTDGGVNWIERTDIPAFFSGDVYFPNSDTGWVAAYSIINPSLYKTTNGGLDWAPIPEVVGARKFHFFPDPVHWIINGFGLRYITNDYGSTWIDIINEVPSGITSFQAPTNFLGYAAGSGGIILRYDDTSYIPVELVSFTGKTENNIIILDWITASELNNYGFEIQRLIANSQWKKIGFVNGNGTTTETNYYNFVDMEPVNGEISYRLKQQDYDGSFSYSNIVKVYFNTVPLTYQLFQNYPNPFNSSTIITYQIPGDEFVTLKVFDVLGSEVAVLIEGNKKAGYYSIPLNANDLGSGIYFYTMVTENYVSTKKMLLLK